MQRRRIVLLLFLAQSLLPLSARAQDRPTVFIHGLHSGPDKWDEAVGHLGPLVAIDPWKANLSWQSTYESQAAELEAELGPHLPPSVIAVGHSNGGIVARQWAAGRDVRSIITLGSPNRGAPLVDHLFDWIGFLDSFLTGISSVNAVYASGVNRDEWWWVPVQWAGSFAFGVDVWNTARQGLLTLGLDAGFRVLPEMRASSAFMKNLNSDSSLSREAAQVPERVAIVNVAKDFYVGGPFRVTASENYEAWHNGIYIAAVTLDGLAGLIRLTADFDDDWAFDLADWIGWVAEKFAVLEEFWCRSISDVSAISTARCYVNDGVVPAWSQAYDLDRLPIIFNPEGGPHTREMSESDPQLYQALTTVAHVPLRDAMPLEPDPPAAPPEAPSTPPVPEPPPPPPPGSSDPPPDVSDPGSPVSPDPLPPDPFPPAPEEPPPYVPDPPSPGSPEPVSPPPIQTPDPPQPSGRYKINGGVCVWDPVDSGPDQCAPLPPPTGRFKFNGSGACYWEPNDYPPDQCSPPAPPTGRYKWDGRGGCYWDGNDDGPDQCVP